MDTWTAVLRGLLCTDAGPLYLRRPLAVDYGAATISSEPVWWPPSKVASRRLAAHLARLDLATDAGQRVSAPGCAVGTLR